MHQSHVGVFPSQQTVGMVRQHVRGYASSWASGPEEDCWQEPTKCVDRPASTGCNKNTACANSVVHATIVLHLPCGPEEPAVDAKHPAEGNEDEQSKAAVLETTD